MTTPHIAGTAPLPVEVKLGKPIFGAHAANLRTNPSAMDRTKDLNSRR